MAISVNMQASFKVIQLHKQEPISCLVIRYYTHVQTRLLTDVIPVLLCCIRLPNTVKQSRRINMILVKSGIYNTKGRNINYGLLLAVLYQ